MPDIKELKKLNNFKAAPTGVASNIVSDKNKQEGKISRIKVFGVLALIIIAIGGFYFYQSKVFEVAKPDYISGYRLVNEKISQSAAIVIHLPKVIEPALAQANIKFSPAINGEWVSSNDNRKIVFKPKEKLKLNRYYSVELAITQSEETVMKADFYSVEDPEIIAIFPEENSEAPEDSEITIIFNRPMVPLTTLGYLEEQNVPVEIIPNTPGRFKWITTRNLQFIPEERLQRSSRYKVKIKQGLSSMDNLELSGKEIEFVTRKLRYINLTKDSIVYNQPISIYFNQPVDLEKIKQEISLTNNTTNQTAPFIIEYGKGSVPKEYYREDNWGFGLNNVNEMASKFVASFGIIWPFADDKQEEKINPSIIQIYNKKDRFNRGKFWDFNQRYTLIINKAYPIEGDIILDESRISNVAVRGVIDKITAESERTNYASSGFFDPQGKLWVSFFEDINLSKTKIKANKITSIGYGEKCKDEGNRIAFNVNCEKIEDKKKIYIEFDANQIALGEIIDINFEKIVNISGLTINQEIITRHIVSYPKFEIFSTAPLNNSANANLTELSICSNSPITVPVREDYKNYFNANLDYELNYWGNSMKITREHQECNIGEFLTHIRYGLTPLSDYSISLNLEDVFSQKKSYSLSFKTGEMHSKHLGFYHFQKTYNVASREETKLTYAARNMDYVNLEICKISAPNFLYYLEEGPRYYQPTSSIKNCKSVAVDTIELQKRYWIKNYFKLDVGDYFEDSIGHYIITFSHPNYKERYGDHRRIYERTYLTITNLSVVEKKVNAQHAYYGSMETLSPEQLAKLHNLYWVNSLNDLQPVSGAVIKTYKGGSNTGKIILDPVDACVTNEQGIAFADTIPNLKGAIVTKGNDSTVIPNYESRMEYITNAYSATKIYLYTDKPIYKPEQEIFVKGIYRVGYDGDYTIFNDRKLNLKAFNSRGNEIFNKNLDVNDFGTFNTKIVLSQNAPLGMYRVCVDRYKCSYFDVQEYVPAAFEVNLNTDKDEYISKDTVNLEIDANYYFGVPLESGNVTYTISSQNYYFDKYSDDYFNFGSRGYYWYSSYYGDKFILRGNASLDLNGKAKISQLLDFEQLFKDKDDRTSKIIVIDATVRNPQGRSVSAQKSFIVHAGEFYLGLKSDKSFLGKSEKFDLRAKTVNSEGKELKVKNIDLDIYKVKWTYNKRLATDGGYSYNWEKQRELVQNYDFDTDKYGNFRKQLSLPEEGSYEIQASVQDKRHNSINSVYRVYVYGYGHASVRPTQNTDLEIEAERNDLNVGDEASIIIKSPYKQAKAIISIERGKIFDYEIKEINGSFYNYKFKIKKEYIPNVYVSVLLISSDPEVKFGKVEFNVNTEMQEIDIEVSSDKNYYLPGEDVNLDISVKDYQNNPVSAELSVAVVDLSVLALKGNPKKNPLVFFYGGFPLTVATGSNLKNILKETVIPTKGGGGGAEDGLARKKRGIFKETAFWQAVVRTDENGKARLRFILPDNLTRWQIEALGLTKDTKTGVGYQEFTSRKDLMVVPLKPRFTVPGDIFHIGAKIFNQTNGKQKLNVKFESQTLVLQDDKAQKTVKIKANKSETIYFKVKSPLEKEKGEHKFIVSAENKDFGDIVEQSINITENDTYETTATANYTADTIVREYVFLPDNVIKSKGSLSVKASATLAVFLSDSLNYLLAYPYGCSEQIASRLKAIAIVQRGLDIPNLADKLKLEKVKYKNREYEISELVDIGLSELYNNQQWDGGFSYWKRGRSNFYLTLHITDTLHQLSLSGFDINQNSLNRASNYLYKNITTNKDLYEDKNTVILAAYTLKKLPAYENNPVLEQKITNIVNDDLFIREQISNTSLAYLAILLADDYNSQQKNKIFTVLKNRIDIDSRGAFLETNENMLWRYYETSVKNTALYLKALANDKNNSPVLDKILRWLLNNRSKDGSWGSTNNTLSVIDAFTDFLQWKQETKSNFDLDLLVNNEVQGSISFNEQTILEQFNKQISFGEIKFNENNIIEFQKFNNNLKPNNFYYDLSLKYYFPADRIPPRDEGFSITREFYAIDDKENKTPLRKAQVGDILRGHLQITVPKTRNFVMIEDYIPAGMEIVNLNLATEEKSLKLQEKELQGREFFPHFKEIRDDKLFLYREKLSPGVYEFDYFTRVLIKGNFIHLPAKVLEMYFPENFGRSDGRYFEVK
jgi:uncharacterized protein YfaS (alpha-2-macroglobulin family)